MHFLSTCRKAIGLLLLVGALLSTHSVFAQEASRPKERPLMPTMPITPPRPEGAVNCFDYYTFGSVEVDVLAEPRATLTGLPIQFRGELRNDNPYPVVDAQVYMKVFHHDKTSPEDIKMNGYPLVDFVLLKEKIALPAKSSVPVSYEWVSPQFALPGEYEAAFFVTSAKRFNLLGLTFTDDVTGNKIPFTLKSLGEAPAPVVFDKQSVTVNGEQFRFASYPPHVAVDEKVTVSAYLENPSNTERTVSLVWYTHMWDGLQVVGLEDRKVETITLRPGERKPVGYTPRKVDSAVTFIVAEVTDRDAKSILNVRFVRDGVPEVRLNFPSVMTFPLQAGKEATLFACAHSTNIPLVPNTAITLTLDNSEGNTIHTYTYSGDITSAMMGVKDTFTPNETYDAFSLTAQLKRDGKIVDKVTVSYDCTNIDASLCVKKDAAAPTGPVSQREPLMLIVGALVTLALIGIVIAYRSCRVKKDVIPPQN